MLHWKLGKAPNRLQVRYMKTLLELSPVTPIVSCNGSSLVVRLTATLRPVAKHRG